MDNAPIQVRIRREGADRLLRLAQDYVIENNLAGVVEVSEEGNGFVAELNEAGNRSPVYHLERTPTGNYAVIVDPAVVDNPTISPG